MKTALFFLLFAGLAACQPANPQATASPKPSPTSSATITEPRPSEPAPSSKPLNTPEPTPSPQVSSSAVPTTAAQVLTLGFQQPLPVASQNIELNFIELVQDSRCPSDVTCIWAGEVTVKVQLKQGGQLVGAADLTLTGDPAKASAKLGDYQLTLLEVTPYPVSTQTRQAADYQIKVQLDVLLDLIKSRPQKTLE